jgi:receptor protein-tyrosine kinase
MTSAISNEFRGIKRKLLQKVRDPQTRAAVSNLIMVTSSLPGEGKTFSSINLALSLAAERGLQVLLIDADVIRPSVGNMFMAPPTEGLTDLLTGKVGHVSDVLHRCADIPNLAVIFAYNPSANTPEPPPAARWPICAANCRRAIPTASSSWIPRRSWHRPNRQSWPAMCTIC